MKKIFIILSCLLTIAYCQLAAQPLTSQEIYDFNVGDEFEYIYTSFGGDPTWQHIRIDSKNISGNSVSYGRTVTGYKYNGVASIVQTGQSTDVVSYPYGTDTLYQVGYGCLGADSSKDTSYVANNWNGRRINQRENWVTAPLSGCYAIGQYGEGLGMVWIYAIAPGDGIDEDGSLTYYKKGTEVHGSATVGRLKVDYATSIKIFPNPVIDNLQFKNLPNDATISIINSLGKKVLSGPIKNGQLDISTLQNGLYIALIETGGQSVEKRFLKLE